MTWMQRVIKSLQGQEEQPPSSSTTPTILSQTDKVGSDNRVQPKSEVSQTPNIPAIQETTALATTSKVDNSPYSRATPNNPETQARVDRRMRIINQ